MPIASPTPPAPPPPITPTAKLLYEESDDATAALTTWPPSRRYSTRSTSRSKKSILICILAILLIFGLGVFVGGFVHAILYPDGGSPLIELPQFLLSAADSNETNWSENGDDVEEPLIQKIMEYESAEHKLEDFLDGDECQKTHSSRLPSVARPIEYDLTLHPNLTTNHVSANVTIRILIKNDTNLIILNAEELILNRVEILNDGHKIEDAEFMECKLLTQWIWKFGEKLKRGDEIEMRISYESEMKSDLQGLYISTHTLKNGSKIKSAATQFEPTFARKMLPCFDEPNFKATFSVAIIREPEHIARSNMNLLISKEYGNGLIKDVFDKSVKMSTYLLAVAVLNGYGHVRRFTANTQKPIEVRLYAPQDVIDSQYEFGLDTTIRALEFFEKYFNISYPLDKVDLLALDDFSEGAMENWGLVTFRDSALLFDENRASVTSKEQNALIICHEIAHQWFGNLVTMDWWDEVFLNEGFANYMEYKCVDELFPDWNIMTRFYAENLAYSQEPDGLLSSRAIESDDNESLLNLFDAINYHKGAAIIHMIAEMAGHANFQRALVEYLDAYAYANAKGVDLWRIVEAHANLQAGGVSIPQLASAYTKLVGYPLVSVEIKDRKMIVHNQTRFLFDEKARMSKKGGDTKWPIPISFRSKTDSSPKMHWLYPNNESTSWDLTTRNSLDWTIVNTGGVGYFKVRYDDRMYAKLIQQLRKNHTEIASIDRAMLLVDTFDLSRTSILGIETYMDMVEYAQKESDKMAWTIISTQLRTIETLIDGSDVEHVFKDFERSLVLRLYESFDWDRNETTPMRKGLQIEAIQMACRLRIKDCTKHAYQRYIKWTNDGVRNPDHHVIVLMEGVKQGGPTAWNRIWKAYGEATSPSERNNIISALATTRDVALINRLLKSCLDGEIKQNVIPRVFSSLATHHSGRTTAWQYLRDNFDKFQKIMGEASSLLATCIRCLAEPLTTIAQLDELKQFMLKHKVEQDGGQMKMEQAYEHVELNIQWRALNEQKIGKWLSDWDERHRKLYRRRRHHPRISDSDA